jgi:hypothetical protein
MVGTSRHPSLHQHHLQTLLNTMSSPQIGQKTTPIRAPLGSSGDTAQDVRNLVAYLRGEGKYASKADDGRGMLKGALEGDISVRQFEFGQSNPTYLIQG